MALLMCQSPQPLYPPHHLHLQLFRFVYFSNFLISVLTHTRQIYSNFDITNSSRYHARFAPMLFQWSHSHMQCFLSQINHVIKRGLEQKNHTVKKSCYVCQGTQWRSITSNRFVLNMVWGHHLQLRSHPPLFHDFRHFNIKVAAAHHP